MLSEKSIWILEDDPGCNFVYEEILNFRYQTRFFQNLQDFKLAIQEERPEARPSLVIADLKLPDGFFLHFLADYQEENSFSIPLIIISFLDDMDVIRFSFKEGACDYLIKPFNKNELIVKIERRLKIALSEPNSVPSSLALDFDQSYLDLKNNPMKLTLKEYEILHLFQEAQGKPLPRENILKQIWKNVQVHPKTVDVHLYNLRKKLHSRGISFRSHGSGCWIMVEHS